MSEQGRKYTRHKEAGMHHIRKLRMEKDEVIPENQIVGSFGIKSPDGQVFEYQWVVNGYRKKPHGTTRPQPMSKYGRALLDAMFGGWHDVR